ADVERPDDALRVVVRRDGRAFPEGRTDDHNVFRNRGRGVETDLACLQVDWLAIAEIRALLQIDDAVLAERADHAPGLGVERDETVARRDVQDAIVAAAVGPVRDAAARQLARR